MIKKQIAEMLIARYGELIEQGKKMSHTRFLSFLENNYANRGVCLLAENHLGLDICQKSYVQKHIKCWSDGNTEYIFIAYWYKIPYCSSSKKEAIECITERIKILKTWLK